MAEYSTVSPGDVPSPPAKRGRKRKAGTGNGSTAVLGFEQVLWQAADKLRGSLDAAEYKHVVLGLIFLKYISDAFAERRDDILREAADPDSDLYIAEEAERYEVAEDRDEYQAVNVFWVPAEARWEHLQANAKHEDIGKLIDGAMDAIERENGSLKGVLPKEYARPALDKRRLGELIDLLSNLQFNEAGHRSRDLLGRVYEYFLGQFALSEGRKAGQFYTPASVVRVLVEMLAPDEGRVFDPCCGSGGMFVQSEKFVEAHGGRIGDIAIYGQESNPATWRMARMILAIRGSDANLGPRWGQRFRNYLKTQSVLVLPAFHGAIPFAPRPPAATSGIAGT